MGLRRHRGVVVAGLGLTLAAAACGDNEPPPAVLVIRGGLGTAGFVEGGTDDHLSDIDDLTTAPSNRGYGQLAALLRVDGFVVEQRVEGPAAAPAPVEIASVELSRYAVVFFASNNASYGDDAVAAVVEFVRGGGGVLFVSDGNWGSFWDKAPSSDQAFLTPFGIVINQDGGGRTVIGGPDFVDPSHPILTGIEAFEGEGVSPCTVAHDPTALATPEVIAITKEVVRRNTAPVGPVEAPTSDDGSLVVAGYGAGRVACHFDRNTFFNANGAGTSLDRVSNAAYARRLFRWLAGRR